MITMLETLLKIPFLGNQNATKDPFDLFKSDANDKRLTSLNKSVMGVIGVAVVTFVGIFGWTTTNQGSGTASENITNSQMPTFQPLSATPTPSASSQIYIQPLQPPNPGI